MLLYRRCYHIKTTSAGHAAAASAVTGHAEEVNSSNLLAAALPLTTSVTPLNINNSWVPARLECCQIDFIFFSVAASCEVERAAVIAMVYLKLYRG